MQKIKTAEAMRIIKENHLKPYFDTWHYCYNIEVFYDEMIYDNGTVYPEKQINKWSPLPVFTSKELEQSSKGLYWFLRMTTFNEFLERRSAQSSSPKKHFPSVETYHKFDKKIDAPLVVSEYSKKEFVCDYDKLRRKEHTNGKELVKAFWKTNKRFPLEWLKVARVIKDSNTVAVFLIADDGISYSDLNSASILDKNGYCVYGLVKMVEHLCKNGYRFFDCGISGSFGGYKHKIFLDGVTLKNVKLN